MQNWQEKEPEKYFERENQTELKPEALGRRTKPKLNH